MKLDKHERAAAIDWAKDCQWADMEAQDFDNISDLALFRGIQRSYVGGWAAFVRDAQAA